MSSPQHYDNAVSFRQALEHRLGERALDRGEDLQRLRQQVAFDRFVMRIQHDWANKWILKGGHALELAVKSARATRDIDLVLGGILARGSEPGSIVRQMLQDSLSRPSGDWFEFQVGQPVMILNSQPCCGERLPVRSVLGGRLFVAFHVDVVVGGILLEPLRVAPGEDWLGFAGIEASPLTTTSLEQQLAEKLHAYAVPREDKRDNSRVKDLVDIVLLLETGTLEPEEVAAAVVATFKDRSNSPIPEAVPDPPAFWSKPYAAMAMACHIVTDVDAAVGRVRDFYRRVLAVIANSRPDGRTW